MGHYAKCSDAELLRKLFQHSTMIRSIITELERRDALLVADPS